ncbi:MAG: WhiB family transcriptional regulator, partial [Rhodoluna sp.]
MGLNDDRQGVPDDWFIDPVLRQLFIDDSNSDTNPLAWQRDAICSQTDPEAFFPEKGGSTRDAKRICSGCDV